MLGFPLFILSPLAVFSYSCLWEPVLGLGLNLHGGDVDRLSTLLLVLFLRGLIEEDSPPRSFKASGQAGLISLLSVGSSYSCSYISESLANFSLIERAVEQLVKKLSPPSLSIFL